MTRGGDVGNPGYSSDLTVGVAYKGARTLGNEDISVGQEIEGPGLPEAGNQLYHFEGRRLGFHPIDHRLLGRSRRRAAKEHPRRQNKS